MRPVANTSANLVITEVSRDHVTSDITENRISSQFNPLLTIGLTEKYKQTPIAQTRVTWAVSLRKGLVQFYALRVVTSF